MMHDLYSHMTHAYVASAFSRNKLNTDISQCKSIYLSSVDTAGWTSVYVNSFLQSSTFVPFATELENAYKFQNFHCRVGNNCDVTIISDLLKTELLHQGSCSFINTE